MRSPGRASPDTSARLPEAFSAACAALETCLTDLPPALLPEGAAAVAGALERAKTAALMRLAAPEEPKAPAQAPRHVSDPLLDVAGLAGRLGRSADWIYRHLPEIPHSRLGRGIRFSETQVRRYLDRNQKSV